MVRRLRVFVAVLVVAGLLGPPDVGGAVDAKCRLKVGVAVRKLGVLALKESERCHKKRMLGQIAESTDCNDIAQMPGADRIGRVADKLIRAATKHCSAESTPAENGYTSCPSPCGSLIITDYASLGECLTCVTQRGAETVLRGIHGDPSPPGANGDATKCLQFVGRALRTYADVRVKTQQRCQYGEERSPRGVDCVTDDSRGTMARGREKAQAFVARCQPDAPAELDSCAATVADLEACLLSAVETATSRLFAAVYPSPTQAGDGYHEIAVPQADGSSDAMTLFALAPDPAVHGDGPFPVVVYGHGQNYRSVANCTPNNATSGVDEARVQPLSDAGHLAIAVQYRNRGPGAPRVGSIRLRDHGMLDARGLLAAARWARDQHGKGSAQVAFIGTSMGTWPAFWAATGDSALGTLPSGLDIRTVILAAESANHFANTRGHYDDVVAAATPEANLQAVVTSGGFITTMGASRFGMTEVAAADLEAGQALGDWLRLYLTEAGVALTSALFFQAPPAGVDCGSGYVDKPPVCADACIAATYQALHGALAEFGPLTDYLTSQGIEAFTFWDPGSGQLDPGVGAANELVSAMRAGSPSYAATGVTAPRALSLLNEADGHYDPDARQLLVDKLVSLGASPVDAPSNSLVGCGHMTYLDASQPQCGLDVILPELAAAFGD